MVLYTTPTELIKIGQDTKDYTINKGNATEEYVIVREFDGEPYVAIPFVEKYSNIEYAVFERPNRIVISYRWDENQLVTTVKKETEIRLEPSIKSVIIAEVNPEDRLVCIGQDEEMTAGFSKVVTVDGVVEIGRAHV